MRPPLTESSEETLGLRGMLKDFAGRVSLCRAWQIWVKSGQTTEINQEKQQNLFELLNNTNLRV